MKLALGVLALVVVGAAATSLPSLRRYLKIERM
jgi:hypothetical protein